MGRIMWHMMLYLGPLLVAISARASHNQVQHLHRGVDPNSTGTEIFFVTSLDRKEPHSRQIDVSNADRLGFGESTITNKQIKSKTSNRNDKYFYSDYLEYFEGHLENYGELMKSRYFEFMEEDLTYKSSSLLGIKGSLKRHITYWENIGASAFILDIISSGYKIPFYLTPESSFSNNNRSAIEHSDFVRDSIEDLIANGFAIKVPFKPACVNPLTVSINKQGKKRLILDLRIPNKLIWKQRVKFEDWKYAMNYFEKGSFMFKFDLKNGYFHIDIFHAHQTYLGFCFDDNFYCFLAKYWFNQGRTVPV